MKKNLYNRLFSFVTAAAMMMSSVNIVANGTERNAGVTPLALTHSDTKKADNPTSDEWRDALGLDQSSRYAGKVWADKTVQMGTDNDFAHTFSLLGSGLKENRSSMATPLDVVFVLDTSYSMASESETYGGKAGNKRIIKSAEALDLAVGMLMDSTKEGVSPYNRVGLVTFDTIADKVLNLGRYNKGSNNKYFSPGTSYSRQTNDFMNVNAQAITASGAYVSSTRIQPKDPTPSLVFSSTENYLNGFTNTQAGIYEGMKMLAEATDTTFWVNAKGETSSTEQPGWTKLERRPIIILLSDGVPTRMCSSKEWWEPVTNNVNQVYGEAQNDAYPELSFISMATGSYMKQVVDKKYIDETPKVFTLGLELPKLGYNVSTEEVELGPLTLDPSRLYNGTAFSTNMKIKIDGYMKDYLEKRMASFETGVRGTGSIRAQFGYRFPQRATYTMNHPDTGIDIDDLNYVDKYYDVSDANYLESYFQDIVDSVLKEAKPIDIPVAGYNAAGDDGYITYTDPIGLYMEVKDVKELKLFGVTYPLHEAYNEGNKTYYMTAYNEDVKNPAYDDDKLGKFELNDIKIWVEKTEDQNADGGHLADAAFKEALNVRIPAEAMPLHWVELDFDGNNNLTDYKFNDTQDPLRLTYDVGIAGEYLKEGTNLVDLNKISAEYKQANTKDDKVYFYSNYFSNTTYDNYADGKPVSRGDAVVTFSPSEKNSYYVFQGSPKVYTDGLSHSTRPDELGDVSVLHETTITDPDAWYYIIIDYYTATQEHKQVAVARKGSEILGGQRVGDMSGGVKDKDPNITETAATYYVPMIDTQTYDDGSQSQIVNVYCGNNGYLAVGESHMLLTKELENINHLGAADETFDFNIQAAVPNGTYSAVEVTYDQAGIWRKDIRNLKIQTDNEGYLQKSGSSELYTKDGKKIRLPGAAGNGKFDVMIEGGFTTDCGKTIYVTQEQYNNLLDVNRTTNCVPVDANDAKAGTVEIWVDNAVDEDGREVGRLVIATIGKDDKISSDIYTESTYMLQNVTFNNGSADVELNGSKGLLFSFDSGTKVTVTEELSETQEEDKYRLKKIEDNGSEIGTTVDVTGAEATGKTVAGKELHINYINTMFFKTEILINGEPTYGKLKEEDDDGLIKGPDVYEGNEIVYSIGWVNDALLNESGVPTAATVTVTDELDPGLDFSGAGFDKDNIIDYPEGDWRETDNKLIYPGTMGTIEYDKDQHVLTWTIHAKASESGKVVLKATVNNKAYKNDEEKVVNKARIKVASDSEVASGSDVVTNEVENPVPTKALTVSKTVTGDGGDRDKDWTFLIKLTPPKGVTLSELSYTGDGKENGTLKLTKDGNSYTGEITLKHGQNVTIEGIPTGTKYTVIEKEANQYGYETTVTGGTTGQITEEEDGWYGTLSKDDAIDFVNKCETGRLEIEKEVFDYDSAEDTEEFTFEVKLTDTSATDDTVTYFYTKTTAADSEDTSSDDASSEENTAEETELTFNKGENGEYTAKIPPLKHGEKITIYGLEYGTSFEVTEDASEGYDLKAVTVNMEEVNAGIASGTITPDYPNVKVKFINERKAKEKPSMTLPGTGGSGRDWFYHTGAVIISMSFALMMAYAVRKKRMALQDRS